MLKLEVLGTALTHSSSARAHSQNASGKLSKCTMQCNKTSSFDVFGGM